MSLNNLLKRVGWPLMLFAIAFAGRCSDTKYYCGGNENDVWNQANLYFELDEPRHCPYSVKEANKPVFLAANAFAPWRDYVGNSAVAAVFNIRHDFLANGQFFWEYDPMLCGGAPACLPFQGYFAGATAVNGSGYAEDSLDVQSWTEYGVGEVWSIMAGKVVPPPAASIAGPTSVPTGTAQNWTANTAIDTLSFLYQWRLDGQSISGAINRTFPATIRAPGNHTMTTIVQRSDYTADTLSRIVYAEYSAYINGPSQIESVADNRWSLTLVGGNPGFTYDWRLDGTQVSTDDYYEEFGQLTVGQHTLSVAVTDSYGYTTGASMTITVCAHVGCTP